MTYFILFNGALTPVFVLTVATSMTSIVVTILSHFIYKTNIKPSTKFKIFVGFTQHLTPRALSHGSVISKESRKSRLVLFLLFFFCFFYWFRVT